jgi:hypothetical protein
LIPSRPAAPNATARSSRHPKLERFGNMIGQDVIVAFDVRDRSRELP